MEGAAGSSPFGCSGFSVPEGFCGESAAGTFVLIEAPLASLNTPSLSAKPVSPDLSTLKVNTPIEPSPFAGEVAAAATIAPSAASGLAAESVPLSTSPTEALTQVTTVLSKASVYCAAHNPGLPEMSTLTVNGTRMNPRSSGTLADARLKSFSV